MICDSHTHTKFSPDSQADPEAMIRRAAALGLRQITFTDHCDPAHPEGYEGIVDAAAYVRALTPLKEKYAEQIYVGIGLEIGYLAGTEETARALAETEGIEYVINSVHVAGGSDCYYERHFDGLPRARAYGDYFETVRCSLDADYPFHAVGHVGYIERKAPYADAHITYPEFAEALDPIFDTIIEREKILELNTNTAGVNVPSLPSPELIAVYFARGGRLVTLSSDAHTPERIACGFADAERVLRDIGFRYVSCVRGGKRVEYKL